MRERASVSHCGGLKAVLRALGNYAMVASLRFITKRNEGLEKPEACKQKEGEGSMSVRRKKVRGDWDTNNCLGSSKLPSPDVSFTMSEGRGLSNRELEPGASSPRPRPDI